MGSRVAVYGLSTEGYSLARQMAVNGADVSLIDEASPSAISLNAEIARMYPDIPSLREDEPLLPMEPIDAAISRAGYLFFAPKIRDTGQDINPSIHSRLKSAAQHMRKGSSLVYNIPVGFGAGAENVSLLEHVTGFEAGKSVGYYYYPVSPRRRPDVVGSFDGRPDGELSGLLAPGGEGGAFVHLVPSEYHHATRVLSHFADVHSVLELSRLARDDVTRGDMALGKFTSIFLDDMVDALYDLRSLSSSFGGTSITMSLINGSIKGLDSYLKRLSDETRSSLRRHNIKASRARIVLLWTLDRHEMRGDRLETLQALATKLRDRAGEVDTSGDPESGVLDGGGETVVVPCSKGDYERLLKGDRYRDLIAVKANPVCEAVRFAPGG